MEVLNSMLDELSVTPDKRRYLLNYLNTLLARGYYKKIALFPGQLFPVAILDHNQDGKVANGCVVSRWGHIVQRRVIVDGSELSFI